MKMGTNGVCTGRSPALGTDQVIYCSTCDLLKQFCETKKKIIFVERVTTSENCFRYKPATTTARTTQTTTATPTTTTTPTTANIPSS